MNSAEKVAALPDIGARFAAGWSSGDPEQFASLFTDDCVYEDVPLAAVARGKAEIADHLRSWLKSSSDIQMKLLKEIRDGNHVAIEWFYTGTHDGPFAGLAPTGKGFAFRGASLFELSDSKISACVDYWDMGYLIELLR